jgi:hypothetical protein
LTIIFFVLPAASRPVVVGFEAFFAALRHCFSGEYNALRHACQGIFAALRQKCHKPIHHFDLHFNYARISGMIKIGFWRYGMGICRAAADSCRPLAANRPVAGAGPRAPVSIVTSRNSTRRGVRLYSQPSG